MTAYKRVRSDCIDILLGDGTVIRRSSDDCRVIQTDVDISEALREFDDFVEIDDTEAEPYIRSLPSEVERLCRPSVDFGGTARYDGVVNDLLQRARIANNSVAMERARFAWTQIQSVYVPDGPIEQTVSSAFLPAMYQGYAALGYDVSKLVE